MMYIFLKLLAIFPLSLLQSIARFFGWILCLYPSSIYRISQINIALAYPDLSELSKKNLIKKSIVSQCLSYIECIKFWGTSSSYHLSLIHQAHQPEILKNAIHAQQGVIVVVAHLGSWELLNSWLCSQTQPMILYKPNKNKALERYILEARQKTNALLVPADETGIRAIFKHLKKGGLTVILPDHTPKASGGIYAEFFQQNVLSTTIVPKLAQKTGARVVGLSCMRGTDLSGFDIHCRLLSEQIRSDDLRHSVNYLNRQVEDMIALAPEQYIWSYKRFRNCENQENPYTSRTTPSLNEL